VIFVAMCGHDYVKLTVAPFFDIVSNAHHLVGSIHSCRHTSAPEVDQHVPLLFGFLFAFRIREGKKKAVAEAYLIRPDS
jgi:hypothetical protein